MHRVGKLRSGAHSNRSERERGSESGDVSPIQTMGIIYFGSSPTSYL